eukprot:Skav201568  [mRNA]  locus=scaffold152:80976:81314:- [translate_table: standard]
MQEMPSWSVDFAKTTSGLDPVLPSPSRTWKMQVHWQVIWTLIILRAGTRVQRLNSVELNAERTKLKDHQGSSRIYDLCKDRARGLVLHPLVLHLVANRAHLCQHLLPLSLAG